MVRRRLEAIGFTNFAILEGRFLQCSDLRSLLLLTTLLENKSMCSPTFNDTNHRDFAVVSLFMHGKVGRQTSQWQHTTPHDLQS